MNTKVYLRKNKPSKGRVSLFFNFYPPIRIPDTNKMTRRYFWGIHLPEKPKNLAEREQVKSIMAKAEIMRLRVLEQLINEKYDFYDKVIEKTDFLEYFHKEALKDNKKWLFVYQHFASFTNNKCTFADVKVALCERFRQYLINTTKLKDKTRLSGIGFKICVLCSPFCDRRYHASSNVIVKMSFDRLKEQNANTQSCKYAVVATKIIID